MACVKQFYSMKRQRSRGYAKLLFKPLTGIKRGLQDRRASAKDAEIKGCGWVAHILALSCVSAKLGIRERLNSSSPAHIYHKSPSQLSPLHLLI